MVQFNLVCLFLATLYTPQILASYAVPGLNEIQDTIKLYLPEGVLLPELNNSKIEDAIKKVTDLLKQKCFEVSRNDSAYDEAYNATSTFSECIQNTVDFSNIGDEIEKAKPTGNLDIVFGKYCSKREPALICLEALSNATDPCLTNDEKSHKNAAVGMIRRLLEFVCHHNGNQIALFIAERGPECIDLKKNHLLTCFNQTYGKLITNELPAVEDIEFTISQENCIDLRKFEDCVIGELEGCEESTSANLAEALFKYVKKETICRNPNTKSSSEFPLLSVNLLILCIVLSLFK
ncbi:hypothetical protein ACKWTF_005307 [Chironomus riparius]